MSIIFISICPFRDCPSGFGDVQGEIVEQGEVKQIFKIRNIIIRKLIASRPSSRFPFEETTHDSGILR
jgi:hypothetical protein